ncbi:hypothetical protein B1992_11930 [Pseudoxanthomonas broegbernensis]|uniref:DUF3613 domain-containing protein n=1 Tax=Pseudoxanthomonas broegbernensis TaxID=83619 RepID=A0A7V8K667_9GAMM|nr:DUF3613 domain-containing protein [Pseudoxanthomonas broegbernensis]KAF1685446.1 hypothetical protein B1992_11930 [Pseudoxanthomonas broegbernensis]MBB6064423.1 hypothetical protein [Pseudoxanthomonas broegbernensis]
MNGRFLLLTCLLLPLDALASDPAQAPLTGRMLGNDPAADRPTPAPAPIRAASSIDAVPALPAAGGAVGDTTRALLRMQADGHHAAPLRPILGAQADASYRRYLRSFEYDIPEFFRATVETEDARAE